MLSQKLKSLYFKFEEHMETGHHFSPQEFFAICTILKAALDDAVNLERRTVPISDQVSALPDNVVQITAAPNRKGFCAGPRIVDEGDDA